MGVFAIAGSACTIRVHAAITISEDPITTLLTSFRDSSSDKKCRKIRVEIDVCDWCAHAIDRDQFVDGVRRFVVFTAGIQSFENFVPRISVTTAS